MFSLLLLSLLLCVNPECVGVGTAALLLLLLAVRAAAAVCCLRRHRQRSEERKHSNQEDEQQHKPGASPRLSENHDFCGQGLVLMDEFLPRF